MNELFKNYELLPPNDENARLDFYQTNKLVLNQTELFKDLELFKLIKVRTNIVTALYHRGRFSEVITEGQTNLKLIKERLDNNSVREENIVNLLNIGYAYIEQARYKESIEHLKQANNLEPKNEKTIQLIIHSVNKLNNRRAKYFVVPGLIALAISFLFDSELSYNTRIVLDITAITLFITPIITGKISKKSALQHAL